MRTARSACRAAERGNARSARTVSSAAWLEGTRMRFRRLWRVTAAAVILAASNFGSARAGGIFLYEVGTPDMFTAGAGWAARVRGGCSRAGSATTRRWWKTATVRWRCPPERRGASPWARSVCSATMSGSASATRSLGRRHAAGPVPGTTGREGGGCVRQRRDPHRESSRSLEFLKPGTGAPSVVRSLAPGGMRCRHGECAGSSFHRIRGGLP